MGVWFIYIVLRAIHRLYYWFRGHVHHNSSFSPRNALNLFLEEHNISVTQHETISRIDKVTLHYRRLGKGRKYLLLANGVGTDFFMWLPILQQLITLDPNFFEKYTLIVFDYRGLFLHDDTIFCNHKIQITTEILATDIEDILKHARIARLEGFIGWSTGAQVALVLCARRPSLMKGMFLLNISMGKTLHFAMQPFIPLPHFVRNIFSKIVVNGIHYLKKVVGTRIFDILKVFNDSIVFFDLFVISAFLFGYPPEQPAYFHEYMKDVFKSRLQVRSLLDLIVSLDEDIPSPSKLRELTQHTVILSGLPDFLTGVYHSTQLAKILPNVKHVNFTMGSHFLLIEWPDLVAKELFLFVNRE